ncbi:hypothetical protein EN817_24295 [Mesorhizobium sp. M3A.F.Ca.ET.174.01.1.1]|uniref:hypothetical protein n=1 Tax=unclassified Mesorhizobium TaxID=325217 RepID=UPI0010936366|nr:MULTISPECIES: hypothetical protein [unclassified Mesorhizobium]TGS62781.1 hypothetical protein EN844_26020 [Mesorhizobium sp. M3A.F.Ca.ET.201.01.1.1]TGS84648.1 hypothetical protein EN818_23445 [Mesorhizobium sp. M3A.F.Ca.ET.175.01.1.1]TGT22837.1 hypothetical protein EN817_24295 [Mesorhizobium sp. M3A.F.Ca.ET.174.01.1.1]
MRLTPVAAALLMVCAAALLNLRTAGGQGSNASTGFVAPVAMDLPDYLRPATDPAFGTSFVRITKPGSLGNGVVCGPKYCSHRYSSAQAWNADQTLLLLDNGCNGMCFLDGHTYVALFHRNRGGECEWHPRNPELMICVHNRAISTWAPRTNQEQVLFTSTAYRDLQFGPSKGNPSRDGSRIAVRAVRKDGAKVVFAYDLDRRGKFPDIDLAQVPGTTSSCTISPLAAYILCFQNLMDGTEQRAIFAVDGGLRQRWTDHHRPGHGDLTVDEDGNEVYVGISKSGPDKFQIIKRRLSDGKVTSLTAYGQAEHASTRALARSDWAFLSYGGNPDQVSANPGWAPYAREVIALRIDGSGAVRRIVQTRNPPSDYWSETHASPSPDGSQVIWSSNWGVPGGPVYDFVARLDWAQQENPKELVANGKP